MIELLLTDLIDPSLLSRETQKSIDRRICEALGRELRTVRDLRGWTREEMVTRLPSGIGDRTLLSYEHGIRHVTVSRLVELCRTLGVCVGQLVERALQAAGLGLEVVLLRVDLNDLVSRGDERLSALMPWARNRRPSAPDGIVELHPLALKELAAAFEYDAAFLATCLVDYMPPYKLAAAPEKMSAAGTGGGAELEPSGEDGRPASDPEGHPNDAPEPAIELDCPLSPDELELMLLIGSGHTSTEIAERLGKSSKSVDRDVQNLCAALGVESRAKALVTCLDRGWIDPREISDE